MITADCISKLAYLDTPSLETALKKNYSQDEIKSSKFLGITSTGQFCYQIRYFDTHTGMDTLGKVYVDLDTEDEPIAQYRPIDR